MSSRSSHVRSKIVALLVSLVALWAFAAFVTGREGLNLLTVSDLNAAVERLKSAGARLLNEPRAGAGGHLYVFIHPSSTGGVLLELIQE